MTAAVLQGVMMNTLDTDIWVDLPTRQYMRLWNMIHRMGGTPLSPTLYVLKDGKVVNFLFEVNGIRDFAAEYRHALMFKIEGLAVKVLPLECILKRKKTTMRDKDLPHIPRIEEALKAKRHMGNKNK